MHKRKGLIVIVLLLTFSATFIVPPTAYVSASPLTDLVSQLNSSTSSGNGLINILLGLLLGKLFGNISNTDASDSKVLGASKITPIRSDGEKIVATARKYLGTSYVWGGETPEGFDCSGFTRYVMKKNGINLPRTAEEQYDTGTPVDKDNLQTGDMVFFTTYKPGASHVGFYLGDGSFIHASSANKEVTISKMDEPFYVEHYIGARRYKG